MPLQRKVEMEQVERERERESAGRGSEEIRIAAQTHTRSGLFEFLLFG